MTDSLPPSWEWARLGDIGIEVRGYVSPAPGTTRPLQRACVPDGEPERVDGESIKSGKRLVEEHDVFLCKINPRINRVWTVGPDRSRPQVASTEYLVMRLHEPQMVEYLSHYLSGPAFREWIKLAVEGATGSHTRAKSGPILEQMVPVPPMVEQRRIVAAIEEHFSRLDATESRLERGLRSVAAFRTSLLTDAFKVDGTLPQDWRRTEIGEVRTCNSAVSDHRNIMLARR